MSGAKDSRDRSHGVTAPAEVERARSIERGPDSDAAGGDRRPLDSLAPLDPADLAAITRDPIDVACMAAEAGDPACGAVLTFSGAVRNHHLSRPVEALAYEAYEPMALAEFERVIHAARERWPDVRQIRVRHRLGRMDVGDSSIFISVAAPHRPEGFAALRFVIDRIKRDAPIWKKEFYADGESEWLHPEEGCCAQHLRLADDAGGD
jgi:molybdopterin synthase catalytic subunit